MALLSSERIVDTAKQIVRTEGYERLSVRGLARRLDVTAPAIYDHLDSKDAVLRRRGVGLRRTRCGVLDHRRLGDRTNAERGARLRRVRTDQSRALPPDVHVPSDAIAIEADNELGAATDVFESGVDDVRQAIADGDLVDRDPVQISLTLWAAIHGVATVSIVAPPVADAVAADVIDAMLVGMRPA